uniref:Maltase-glucoamylase n=1 Tax=Anisakis simplex TaxID=6269 RepID=A0A0M3KE34_ANISI
LPSVQLCRFGYKDLDDVKKTVERVQDNGIPIDVAYADIDYMDRYKDFTLGDKWQAFGEYADELHRKGLHLNLIFDPAIQVDYPTFERALKMNASFIEWQNFDQVPRSIQQLYPLVKNTKIMLGLVWPDRHTAFPDFLDPQNATAEWWINEFKLFHKTVMLLNPDDSFFNLKSIPMPYEKFRFGVAFDGIWIDMNEPANFRTNEGSFGLNDVTDLQSLHCPLSGSDSEFDKPPFETANVYYFNYGSLSTKTICMLALSNRGTQRVYDTKNLYGLSEAIATRKAIHEATGRRGVIISRSSYPSLGHYAGHWLGDNSAHWADLRTSVIGVQEFNLFGIPYVGSDICGFIGATNEELCLRWQQLGAFHSFSRNHNDDTSPPQDPAQWPSVATATRIANLFRYHYLPYLYSLHFEASLYGGTVVRPIFFEFPSDPKTYELSFQFMWGSGMMIVPVLEQGVSTVSAYLPANATWYSVRSSDYDYDEAGIATGKLYWDDGESIIDDISTYNYSSWQLDFVVTDDRAALYITDSLKIPSLDIIDIIGYDYFPDLHKATMNGKAVSIDLSKSSYNILTKRLYIETDQFIKWPLRSKITLTWPHTSTRSSQCES